MSDGLPPLVSALITLLLPPLLQYFDLFVWLDLGYRIILAELNRYRNGSRYDLSLRTTAPKTMACIVGYREASDVYEKSLESLRDSKVGTVVVAVDGDDEEDLKMLESFKQVFRDSSSNVIHAPLSVGKQYVRHLRLKQGTCHPVQDSTPTTEDEPQTTEKDNFEDETLSASSFSKDRKTEADHRNGRHDSLVEEDEAKDDIDSLACSDSSEAAVGSLLDEQQEAFAEAYEYLRAQLDARGFRPDTAPPQAICITQPHEDLKEIRFTAWMLSFVLADMYSYTHLWSTDSDTRVSPTTIDIIARVLSATPSAAAASAYVQLHNASTTLFARMASAAWALDTYLNRAALGAMGRSECLHGPSSCFDIARLRTVAVQQYLFQYFDQEANTVLNEDIQTTMLLAWSGWDRLYVENCSMLTGGPESLRAWLGQRLRWSRGINLHRLYDARYIISQGPLTAWYWIRSGFYDVFVFLWVTWYTLTGRNLFPVTLANLIALEILPPLYNLIRCPIPIQNLALSVAMYLVYRIVCPSYRMYTLLTPFGVSWALPKRDPQRPFSLKDFLRREHESLFFVLWAAIVAGAVGRGCAVLVGVDTFAAIAACMVSVATATGYAMFMA